MLQVQVFFDQDDRHDDRPLADYLIRYLLRNGIRGATIFAATTGFGEKRRIHEPRKIGHLDESPLLLIFTDDEARVREVLPHLRQVVRGGMVLTLGVTEVPSEPPS